MNYPQLKTELETSEFSSKSDEQILAIFNEVVLNGLQYMDWPEVNNHAKNALLLTKLKRVLKDTDSTYDEEIQVSAEESMTLREIAEAGLDLLGTYTDRPLNPNNPTLVACAQILQSKGVFTPDEITAFWNVFRTSTTRALTTYQQPLSQADLNIARLYDTILIEQFELGQMREAVATKEARVARFWSGENPDEDPT